MTKVDIKENVRKIEDILGESSKLENENNTHNTEEKRLEKVDKKHEKQEVPKGKPKSGRVWKEPKKRFSSIIKTRGIRLSFEKKQKLREDLKRVKEMSRSIKEEKKAEKEAKKQRRIENIRRAEENRKKSEIVQVIKNTAKIKKMKKKQLRLIEKRDTTKIE